MKKHFSLLLFATMILAGCIEQLTGSIGSEVTFSTNTYYDNGPATKTAYSGVFYGTTIRYERIDWASGDKIRIYSPEAAHRYDQNRHWADYDIDASSIRANNVNSTARIKNEPNSNGLVWGSGNHTFYGLYPSPRSTSAYAGLTMNDNVVTAPLPESQALTLQPGTRTYKPDMNLAYMHAAVSNAPVGIPVDLPFRPLMTAFEITLGTDDPAGIAVKSIYLSTDALGSELTGTFEATINANNTVTVGAITNPSRFLYVNLPEFASGGTVNIRQGQPITFTVFALPITIQKLALKVILADNTSKEILFKQNGNWIDFLPFKKYRITNLNTPPGETWTYTIEVVDPVTGEAYNSSNPLMTYGHFSTTSSTNGLPFIVKSYKTSSATGASTPVTWKMQFKSGSSWVDNIANSDFAGKLAVSALTGNGSTAGETVRSDIARDHTSSEYYHHGSIGEDTGAATLRARTPLPSTLSDAGDGYFDLSKHPIYGTIDGAEQPQETANCYVITAPGKYKLPLVYGNAIRNGNTNAVSYQPTVAPGTNDNNHYMRQFLRHDDRPITGPWITADNGITVSDAVVVWQDGSTSADMQILFADDISVSGNYIKFEIKKDKIRPGNIVLAARNASGTIVWSWHLWVTEKDLTPISVKDLDPVTHMMMKYNLGWTDAISAGGYKWEDWDMDVRLVQIENNTIVGDSEAFVIGQHGENGEVDPNVGSNTYYQWGRKDPLLPANYGNTNRPYYTDPALGYQITEQGPDGERVCWRVPPTTSAIVTAGHSIQHPNYQYAKQNSSQRTYLGGSGIVLIGNLWNANMIPYGAGYDQILPTKTVYDPCPPEFVVPYGRAYSGLTGSYDGWVYPSSFPSGVSEVSGQGYRFSNVPNVIIGDIFFPFCGARGGDGRYIYDVKTLGYYWTAQPDDFQGNYREYAKFFYMPTGGPLRARHDQDRAAAYAIRPVLETRSTAGPSALPQSSRLPAPSAATEQGW